MKMKSPARGSGASWVHLLVIVRLSFQKDVLCNSHSAAMQLVCFVPTADMLRRFLSTSPN